MQILINVILSVILTFIGLFAYFLPTYIACEFESDVCDNRELECSRKIFLVNLFFGWTIIGWVVSLISAVGIKNNEDD